MLRVVESHPGPTVSTGGNRRRGLRVIALRKQHQRSELVHDRIGKVLTDLSPLTIFDYLETSGTSIPRAVASAIW